MLFNRFIMLKPVWLTSVMTIGTSTLRAGMTDSAATSTTGTAAAATLMGVEDIVSGGMVDKGQKLSNEAGAGSKL